jgi:Flp pilus assembly protein TadG
MRPPPRFLAAWGADRRGTVAIEFAFVAGPFLLMMFAVIELALVFLVSSSLDTASSQAARRIRTGEFQSAAQTEQQFKQGVCDRMTWLSGDCMEALVVDVRTYTNFTSITDPLLTPVAGSNKMSFSPGNKNFQAQAQPSTIVVVRSYYQKDLITPFYSGGLARVSGSPGKTLILSTQVFRTEPFQPVAPTT